MANPVRIALSDPHGLGRPRFVVGGQAGTASGDVKLYEWRRSKRQMGMGGLQTDVGQIRALAWSPSHTHHNLVATGLSTGRTLLLSLSPSTLSPTLPITNRSPVLNVRHSRPVTALSFSTADPNYLASGLERHRSDYSLLVWDLTNAISSISPHSDEAWQRPLDRLEPTHSLGRDMGEIKNIQHYCPAEHINSVAFVPGTIHSLLASANNKVIRLYDLRVPGPSGASSPRDPASASRGAVAQWATRAVNGLSPDPSGEGRFASWESVPDGSVVRVWDARKPTGEMLSFEVGAGGVVGLEWLERGRLGVGTKDGVSVWEIVHGRWEEQQWTMLGEMRTVVKTKQAMQSFAFDRRGGEVLFVVKDGTIGIGPVTSARALVSGARGDLTVASTTFRTFEPDSAPHDQDDRRDGDIDDRPNDDASQGSESDSPRANRFQLPPARVSDLLAEASDNRSRSISPSSSHAVAAPRREARMLRRVRGEEGWMEDGAEMGAKEVEGVLRGDVGHVMRRRAEDGYGLDNLLLNAAIATCYPGQERLKGIWEFIDHLTRVMDPITSKAGGYDLTNAGAHPIWTGNGVQSDSDSPSSSTRSGSTLITELAPVQSTVRETVKQGSAAWSSLRNHPNQQPPISSLPSAPKGTVSEAADPGLTAAIQAINARRTDSHPGSPGTHQLPRTEREGARRMILALCGEMHEGAGIGEIHHSVFQADERQTS